MFNFIDIYIFIPVSGCEGRDTSLLICLGPIMLLRQPCRCKAKLCPMKLCPPGQYFMIILSWNFVLSMIGQYNNVMLWTIYHSETVS